MRPPIRADRVPRPDPALVGIESSTTSARCPLDDFALVDVCGGKRDPAGLLRHRPVVVHRRAFRGARSGLGQHPPVAPAGRPPRAHDREPAPPVRGARSAPGVAPAAAPAPCSRRRRGCPPARRDLQRPGDDPCGAAGRLRGRRSPRSRTSRGRGAGTRPSCCGPARRSVRPPFSGAGDRRSLPTEGRAGGDVTFPRAGPALD